MSIFKISLCYFPAVLPLGKVVFVMKTLPCKRTLQSVLLNIDLNFQAVAAFINSVPIKTTGRCIVYLHKAGHRCWPLPSWDVRKRKWLLPVELGASYQTLLAAVSPIEEKSDGTPLSLSRTGCQHAAVTLAGQLCKSPICWTYGRKHKALVL